MCHRCRFYVQAKSKVCHICGFTSFIELKKKEAEKPDQIKIAMQRSAELARSLKKIATAASAPSLYEPPRHVSE